jgi:GTP-binding protein HflX
MVDNKRPIVYSDDETSFAFPMVSSKEGFKKKTKDFMEKALLVGLQLGQEKRWSIEDSLEELGRLADTAGAQVVDTMIQHRSHRDPAFLIGPGKAEQIGELCRRWGVDLVIFNDDLSPNQIQHLEKALSARVIDRTGLILDIFAKRARTSEGKLQVELAQMQYLLSHLVGKGRLLSQLGGGIGTRGPGETQLELDRRKIKRRINKLEDELSRVRKTRALHREQRRAVSIPTVAVVGYTNAGKSTLFNSLTRARVLVEDKLFATLDPTMRRVKLPNKREILLSDTVGFIQRLPHQLVAAFKATLEEVLEADLLLHIIDISHPQAEDQRASVQKTLKELGADKKPRLEVYNKIDLSAGNAIRHNDSENPRAGVFISAVRGDGIQDLLERVETMLFPSKQRWQLMIPVERGDILARLYRLGRVTGRKNQEQGVRIEAEVPVQLTDIFLPFRVIEAG